MAKSPMILIRAEAEEDHSAVRYVNELAFGRQNEANLVDALRERVNPYVSLVALLDGEVVGHIFFSPVLIESEEQVAFEAMGLAPMAVLPGHQRQGIGTLLVRDGLRECLRLGYEVVVVVGHPEYYPRFGFMPARPKGLLSEYDVPDEVCMVAELRPGALGAWRGLVKYHSEFSKV